eukprot:CAMPEP_0205801930 /NCGR_PEP_ID=MMETSP0205-20121125/4096_1 /ASSEMBLY_ACC=CAM_ASM_000278 /TAXON_ID=36767 /ORGANISM="Euplotes focardii, Strain TN1" /LENGTH=47 /DNA_ID= /DNA_START= /DNA_END= /DNA_ORIENTATION=
MDTKAAKEIGEELEGEGEGELEDYIKEPKGVEVKQDIKEDYVQEDSD